MTSNSVDRLPSRATAGGQQLPQALHVLQPQAARLLERVNEHVWGSVDPVLLELLRLRMAWLTGDEAGQQARSWRASARGLSEEKISELSRYPTSSAFTPLEVEALAFAEQFVMDASGTTQESLDALKVHLGTDDLREFVTAVYVVEFTQRLQTMAGLLFPGQPPGRPAGPREAESPNPASLRDLLAEFQEAVVRGDALDAVTTELVRLRCARTHSCRICTTLRLGNARQAGVDEPMTTKIDFYETSDLPERAKVALRITDAFIIRPDAVPGEAMQQAQDLLTQEELAELCLDITKWSTQKIHVALGLDGADRLPTNEEGVAFFDLEETGGVAGYWADAPGATRAP